MAVIVSQGKDQFPELLKVVRQKVDPGITRTVISKIRHTKTGSLLVEINSGVDSAEIVRAELERSLGPGSSVMLAEDFLPIEVRNLDGLTTKEEVFEAIVIRGGVRGKKLVSLRKSYGEVQTAIVLFPVAIAKWVCEAERLRVGLVYVRVRITDLQTRCYRCRAFGHVAREYAGEDRSTCCWRCGEAGHQSRGCTATLQVAAAFRQSLSKATGSGTPSSA